MTTRKRALQVILLVVAVLGVGAPAWSAPFPIARIYIEYNSSANDLGFHVSLDAEDWTEVEIRNPAGSTIFEVEGTGAYGDLGLTELFFEGAEPSLDDFPLDDLLDLFPEGRYRFIGTTVDGATLTSRPTLSHAVPAGPEVSATVNGNTVVISWTQVTEAPDDFPVQDINVVGYQVIVDPFQVTLPASITHVTLPREFVQSLSSGTHDFEVLAIEESGNQTITEGTFVKP
jgi:hypothetical protein